MSDINTLKTQIQSLIDGANATTGNSDTNLTDGVNALVEGYGQGGSGKSLLHIGIDQPSDTSKIWVKTKPCEKTNIVPEKDSSSNIATKYSVLDRPIEVNDSITVVGDKIYIVCGYDNDFLSEIRCFNPSTKTTEIVKDLGDSLNASLVTSVNENIYVFGGWSGSRNVISDRIYCYNTTNNTVRTIEATITARENGSAVTVGDKIYILGGFNGSNYDLPIEIFDVVTETVETLSVNTTLGKGARATAVGKIIYYVCGFGPNNYSNNVYKFDTETHTFETNLYLTYSVHICGIVSFEKKIIYIGWNTWRCAF